MSIATLFTIVKDDDSSNVQWMNGLTNYGIYIQWNII